MIEIASYQHRLCPRDFCAGTYLSPWNPV